MKEIWKDIKGYDGLYQVSNFGRIKSLRNNKIMKTNTNGKGYVKVGLCANGKTEWYKVHRLVALEFVPNNDNKPEINHINNIRNDNKASNLEWCYHKENMALTRGKPHNYFKKRKKVYNFIYHIYHNGVFIKSLDTIEQIKKSFKISNYGLEKTIRKNKKHKGYEIIKAPHPLKIKKGIF